MLEVWEDVLPVDGERGWIRECGFYAGVENFTETAVVVLVRLLVNLFYFLVFFSRQVFSV